MSVGAGRREALNAALSVPGNIALPLGRHFAAWSFSLPLWFDVDRSVDNLKEARYKFDAFARRQNRGWLSKKRHLQGAQLSSNEEYLDTSMQ